MIGGERNLYGEKIEIIYDISNLDFINCGMRVPEVMGQIKICLYHKTSTEVETKKIKILKTISITIKTLRMDLSF